MTDQTTPAISVVIPLFNEQDNIAILQKELADALAGRAYEIVFVDDASRDATLSKIDRRPEIRVLEFEKNAGQSAGWMYRVQSHRALLSPGFVPRPLLLQYYRWMGCST